MNTRPKRRYERKTKLVADMTDMLFSKVKEQQSKLQWLIINQGDGTYNLFSNRDRFGNMHDHTIIPWAFHHTFNMIMVKIKSMEDEFEKG